MGRKKLPSAIHRKNGSYIKDPQRENKLEPTPPAGHPEKTDLVKADKLASEKWDELCELLSEMDVLSQADKDLLELICINWSQYVSLTRKVAQDGVVIEQVDHKGNLRMVRSPYAAELSKIADRQMKLLMEFGLTPSTRSKITVVGDKHKSDPMVDWISRGGLN